MKLIRAACYTSLLWLPFLLCKLYCELRCLVLIRLQVNLTFDIICHRLVCQEVLDHCVGLVLIYSAQSHHDRFGEVLIPQLPRDDLDQRYKFENAAKNVHEKDRQAFVELQQVKRLGVIVDAGVPAQVQKVRCIATMRTHEVSRGKVHAGTIAHESNIASFVIHFLIVETPVECDALKIVHLSLVVVCHQLRLAEVSVLFDANVWAHSPEPAVFSQDERTNGNFLAVSLDKALVKVAEEEHQFALVGADLKILRHFKKLG